jgi:hypothetical protein
MDQIEPSDFYAPLGEKWSVAEHIDHLIRSLKPLNQGMRLPKFVIRWVGGKPSTKRNYDEVVQAYQSVLQSGGKATGRYIPKTRMKGEKSTMINEFQRQGEKLRQSLECWTEDQLDRYAMPHPLLGKISVREMLFFTIYHNQHHLNILMRDFGNRGYNRG